MDQGTRSAIRRNVIGGDDGSVKYLGIEIIARDVIVTDNVVNRGAHIGLSVSNVPVKNNVYWGHNTVRDCIQWGAQLQGEKGGIAHHYFYDCTFEDTVRGDPRARYPDSGHGFRTNGSSRGLTFENCTFRNNGGYGLQFVGTDMDAIRLVNCAITNNKQAAVTGPSQYTALEFIDCRVSGNQSDALPAAKPFPGSPPKADFHVPASIRASQPITFECTSKAGAGAIVERLWDFGEGIPETVERPQHTFGQPGKYRVTLIVWDSAGRGARAEKTIEVLRGE